MVTDSGYSTRNPKILLRISGGRFRREGLFGSGGFEWPRAGAEGSVQFSIVGPRVEWLCVLSSSWRGRE
jgi:hypothetical protein